jgi:hypothetical protein
VVAPTVEQLALAGSGGFVQAFDPAHDQRGGDLRALGWPVKAV